MTQSPTPTPYIATWAERQRRLRSSCLVTDINLSQITPTCTTNCTQWMFVFSTLSNPSSASARMQGQSNLQTNTLISPGSSETPPHIAPPIAARSQCRKSYLYLYTDERALQRVYYLPEKHVRRLTVSKYFQAMSGSRRPIHCAETNV